MGAGRASVAVADHHGAQRGFGEAGGVGGGREPVDAVGGGEDPYGVGEVVVGLVLVLVRDGGQEGAGAVGCVLGHPCQVLGAGPGAGRVVEGGGEGDDGVEVEVGRGLRGPVGRQGVELVGADGSVGVRREGAEVRVGHEVTDEGGKGAGGHAAGAEQDGGRDGETVRDGVAESGAVVAHTAGGARRAGAGEGDLFGPGDDGDAAGVAGVGDGRGDPVGQQVGNGLGVAYQAAA